jgi:hypothetical protein
MTAKIDLPVHKVRAYLEPGPIVLVSSAWRGERNVMTLAGTRSWSSRRRWSAA